MPRVGPKLLLHSILAPGFGAILTGSFPEGLTSVNRKDWLSGIALVELPIKQRKLAENLYASKEMFSF